MQVAENTRYVNRELQINQLIAPGSHPNVVALKARTARGSLMRAFSCEPYASSVGDSVTRRQEALETGRVACVRYLPLHWQAYYYGSESGNDQLSTRSLYLVMEYVPHSLARRAPAHGASSPNRDGMAGTVRTRLCSIRWPALRGTLASPAALRCLIMHEGGQRRRRVIWRHWCSAG